MVRKGMGSALALLAWSGLAQAATLTVDATAGSDTGDCLASACKTITYANLRAAPGSPGDTILVAPGTYDAALGEAFPIGIRSGVQLRASGTAAQTVVDGGGQKRLIHSFGAGESTLIEGFTLTRGVAKETQNFGTVLVSGGAIQVDAGRVTIRRNIFADNRADGGPYTFFGLSNPGQNAQGGAIHVAGGTAVIESNVFVGNMALGGKGMSGFNTGVMGGPGFRGDGGAIYVATSATIVNNTFHGNEARGGDGVGGRGPPGYGGSAAGGAIRLAGGVLVNNIFSANKTLIGSGTTGGGAEARNGAVEFAGRATNAHNLYFGNTAAGVPSDANPTGEEARFADPQFAAAPSDLRLADTSPALGAGRSQDAATTDFNGATRPRIPSIGAHESASAIAPVAIDFGSQSMGTVSVPRGVVVSNRGSGALVMSSVATSSAAFIQAHDCATLAAGAHCVVGVSFAPPASLGALNETAILSGTLVVNAGAQALLVTLQGTVERSLVRHYYRTVLRRPPDAGGRDYWSAEAARVQALGASVNEAWYAMAAAFFSSAEYLSQQRNDTEFVSDLYNTFFGRAPDNEGLGYWTGLITAGMPREVVLATFMFSEEFRGFAAAIFGAGTARAEIDMVMDFYRGFLSRLPEDTGFNTWLAQLREAQCRGAESVRALADSLSATFLTGPEYVARNRSDDQFVGDLYNAFLRRGGDADGVRYWVDQLATAASTREALRQAFVQSPEFTRRVDAVIAQGCVR